MSTDERTLGERVEDVRLVLSTDMFRKDLHRAHTMVMQEADALLREQQAEIERLKKVANDHAEELDSQGVLLAQREFDLEAARVDAERYRWLRKGGFNLPDLPYRRQSFAKSVAEIEAAIDRCRRADGEDDND